jgi:drug/metabolite transporter (DMT)-like permease
MGLLGYAVFGDVPDRWTVVGAATVVASGLYLLYRERRRSRQKLGPRGEEPSRR